MNAIVPVAMPLQDMQTLAVAIARSGLFGIKTPEQALVLMAIAQAEGRHPVEAARDYDIINNRPAKKAEAMLRDFIKAGGTVKWHSLTDELADATFTHPQTGEVRIDWDMKRAATAFGKKDMYTKFPRQMLRSRVVSEGVRTLWPLATSGMYEVGEAADIQPEHNGPTIEHSANDEREQINRDVPLKAAATDMQRTARIAERAPTYEAPVDNSSSQQNQKTAAVRQQPDAPVPPSNTRRTAPPPMGWQGRITALRIAFSDCKTADEVDQILCGEDVAKMRETFKDVAAEELETLIAETSQKWWPEEGEVVIAGAENVGAG